MFEVIEIHHDRRQRRPFAQGAAVLAFEGFEQSIAVPEPGERIVSGLLPQRLARFHQVGLEVQNPPPRAQPHPQFFGLERLGDVIVGARVHPLYDVLLVRARRQQQHVGVRLAVPLPQLAAQIRARHPRHHPIQNGKPRRVLALENLPRLVAIVRGHHLVAVCRQHPGQHPARYRVIVSDEYNHALHSLIVPIAGSFEFPLI